MFRHYHSKTFYKYLFSYFSVMLLSVSIITIYVLCYLFPMIRKEIDDSHRVALGQTASSIDAHLNEIYHISYQISYYSNNLVSYYAMEDTPTKDVKIINELKSYTYLSSFISDIGLLSSSSSFLYTSTDVYPRELFFKNEYIYPTMKNPVNLFLSYSSNTVLPASIMDPSCRYITFVQPPYALSNLPDTTLLFWVSEAELAALAEPVTESGISFITVISPTGEPVYCSSKELSREDSLRLCSQALQGDGSGFSTGRESYTLFTRPSQINNWTYVYAINNRAASRSITVVWLLLFVVLFLTVLLGIPVIAYYMRLNYLPLKQMKTLTDKLLDIENNPDDEVSSLQNALQYLSGLNRNQLSCLQDDELILSLRSSLLFSLLKGHISTREEFNESAAALGMSLTAPNCQTLLIHLADSGTTDTAGKQLGQLLALVFTEGYQYYFREFFHEDQYVVVLAFGDDRRNDTPLVCRQLADLALERGSTVTIGIGQIYREFTGFQASCLEADLALQDSFVAGHGAILTYQPNDRSVPPDYRPLSIHLFSSLHSALKRKDIEDFSKQTEQLFSLVEDGNVPTDYARIFCHSLASLLIHELPREDMSRIAGSLSLMYQADTLSSYRLHLANVLQKLLSSEDRDSAAAGDSLLVQIRQYVAQNFDDCNFSLQKCADALHINNSYLSHYFKEQTGMTLNHYIASLRIERAKELLADTNLSLSVISEEVGYYNLNSFIRRFKQITGSTPGNYRKNVSDAQTDGMNTRENVEEDTP